MRPSGAGLGNMSGQECTFSYMYTCIGYKLPTFGECMSVGGFLCALRAQGWGIFLVRNVHFLICILLLDINCQLSEINRQWRQLSEETTVRGDNCQRGQLSEDQLSVGHGQLSEETVRAMKKL